MLATPAALPRAGALGFELDGSLETIFGDPPKTVFKGVT